MQKPLQSGKIAAVLFLLVAGVRAAPAEDAAGPSTALQSAANQIKLRHFRKAHGILRQVLLTSPTAETYNLLGVDLVKLGDPQGARTAFEQAITLDRKFAAAYTNLADLLLSTGDEAEAMKLFKSALVVDPSILARDPASYLHFNIWGLCLMDAQKYSEAERAFHRAIRINPGHPAAHANLGDVYAIRNLDDKALREFFLALAIKPNDARTNNNIGLVYGRQGKLAAAVKYLYQAHKLSPEDRSITARLMATELQLKHRSEARALLSGQVLWDSLSASARVTMATLWLMNGDAATGAQVVSGDEQAAHNYYQSAYAEAEADLDKGDYSEAKDILTAIHDLQLPSAEFHDLLGSTYYAMGDPKKAFDEFQLALQLKPADPDYFYKLGMVFLKNHTPDPAISVFEAATKIRPDAPKLWFGLGMSYYFASHLDQAEKTLHVALALDPRYQTAYVVLGDLLYQSGRADEAVALLRRATDLRPDWYLPYYYYGFIALRRGQVNTQDVIGALREATRLNPQFSEAHCELGKALARAGDNQEAMQELERSVDLDSDMAEPHYQLAAIYRTLGDKRRSAEELALFETAKGKSNPGDQIAKELQSFTSGIVEEHRSPDRWNVPGQEH